MANETTTCTYLRHALRTTPRCTAVLDLTLSFLEFGRLLRLPSDLVEPEKQIENVASYLEYAQQLKNRLTKAFQTAKNVLHAAHKTQKDFYDRWARVNVFKEGDVV